MFWMDWTLISPTPDKPMVRRRFLKGVLGAAALAAGDAVFLEPRWLRVTRHTVLLPHLPREQDGLTLVQLSDLHRGPMVSDDFLRRAVQVANGLGADVAVLTGDFISRSPRNAGPCAEILSALVAPRGRFAVLGNHDHWHRAHRVVTALEGVGIPVLINRSLPLAEGLFLAGVDDWWIGEPDLEATFRDVPPRQACVLLSHSPKVLPAVAHREVLVLAGHTHGGQVNLPPIPRRWLPGLRGWRYIAGWYREGQAQMYVNRGVGLIFPPIRFCCPPEISLFTLRPLRG